MMDKSVQTWAAVSALHLGCFTGKQSAVEIGGSVVLQLTPWLKRVCVKLIEALLSCYRYGLLLTGDPSIDLLGEAEEAEAALCGATVKPNHINT